VRIERQLALVDETKHRRRCEQDRQRRDMEARVEFVRDPLAVIRQTIALREQYGLAALDEDGTRKIVGLDIRLKVGIELLCIWYCV